MISPNAGVACGLYLELNTYGTVCLNEHARGRRIDGCDFQSALGRIGSKYKAGVIAADRYNGAQEEATNPNLCETWITPGNVFLLVIHRQRGVEQKGNP